MFRSSHWSTGEQVADRVSLALPRPLQAGDSVIVGLYVLPDTTPVPLSTGEPFIRRAL